METPKGIQLNYKIAEELVDLSKPYPTDQLYYRVEADGDVRPNKENTLYLPIKGGYFEDILAGKKYKEYREIKETTYNKYLRMEGKDLFYLREDFPEVEYAIDFYYNGYYPFIPKPYRYLKLAVGYRADRDWAIVEVDAISFQPAEKPDGGLFRFDYDEASGSFSESPDGELTKWIIVYHLGKVVECRTGSKEVSNIDEAALKQERIHSPHFGEPVRGSEVQSSKRRRNFDFLKHNPDFADLYTICNEAEVCQYTDPNKSALSARQALEYITRSIYLLKEFEIPPRATLFELVSHQEFVEFINDRELMRNLHYIRKVGNNAAHQASVTRKESFFAVLNLYNLVGSVLMMLGVVDQFPRFESALLPRTKEVYFTPKEVVEPSPQVIKKYEPVVEHQKVLTPSKQPKYFTEAETRKFYIDLLLKEAGWELVESENTLIPNKAGIEIKVEGMPNEQGVGFVDYVLCGRNGKPMAVIEAKKTSKEPASGKHQAELYADCLEAQYGVKPIIYYTNGYEIYCIDRLGYPPRLVSGFHSREDLEVLLQRQGRKQELKDLSVKDEITNREYQKRAIRSLCDHLNQKHRRGLLVMATGTGKTRVSISLVDVLMRNDWVKNVLFLADRTALVEQANKNYTKLLPNVTTSILSSDKPDKNARILLSTYQTMINYIDADIKEFSIGRFDLIIIDEAHRSIFGRYMSIFNYFDAYLIGLTATPRNEVHRSTYEVFNLDDGNPNFDYELEEAVQDGYLVPCQVINRKSDILTGGIKYDQLSQEEKDSLEEVFEYERLSDNMEVQTLGRRDFEPREMYKYLFNEDTVDQVLHDLMTKGRKVSGNEKVGKSIIFAYNHEHAQQIVKRFYKIYPQYGEGFCVLVDYSVNYAQNLIEKFEVRESNPQIVVSVDMLDTGIDVPDVLNLVFFKTIRSKIKFMQMIGRGTRLSEDIYGPDKHKEDFLIFDYCGNFEYFNHQYKEPSTHRLPSLSEQLFNLKVDIISALQELKYLEDEYLAPFGEKLKEELHEQVSQLNRNRIDVRSEWARVDKYSSEKAWEYLSPVDVVEVKSHVSPLLMSKSENENRKRFDIIMLNIELSRFDKEVVADAYIQKVVAIASTLQKKKLSIDAVKAKLGTLKEVQTDAFWEEVTISELERVRKELRELVQFLEPNESKIFEVNIEDTIRDGEEVELPKLTMSYRQKVMEYLCENSDNPVIQKIKNLEQLTHGDIEQLERVLWEELGSKEEYEKQTKDNNYGNVAIFIRTLVGINREVALQMFSNFIDHNTLNATQLEYLKTILDYVSENGNISSQELFNKDQLKGINWVKIFGGYSPKLGVFVDTIHRVVIA